jgi:hypothetical protein
MDTTGPAVTARGPAALEAAVQDMIEAGSRADGDGGGFDDRCATVPIIAAEVEVWQPALEQKRKPRTDGMTVVKQGDAVTRLEALNLPRQRGVIRCKRRSNNPSVKRPNQSVAPE